MPNNKLYSLTFSIALTVLGSLPCSVVSADDVAVESDRVTLAMILPALEGSELGALDIAASPRPGESSVIRSSDIKAKLKENGKETKGLAIPKSVRVTRPKRDLDAKELEAIVQGAIDVMCGAAK